MSFSQLKSSEGRDPLNLPTGKPYVKVPLTKGERQTIANSYAGQLLLRHEINLHNDIFNQLLKQKHFTAIQAITHKFYKKICHRCGNTKRYLFGMMDCSACQESHLYCRKCIDMGRVMSCEPLYYWSGDQPVYPHVEESCKWKGQLTTYQQIGSDRIVQAIQSQDAELLVWGVCGAGKTEMLFSGVTAALALNKRICIATPRSDVVRELLPRFKKTFPDILITGRYGGSQEKDSPAQLMISTTHQLYRFKQAFDIMIIDEVDAFPYHADQSLPFATNRAKKVNGTVIYLTATPRQKHKMRIQQHKLEHVFIPKRYHGYPLPVPRLKMCFSLQKDLKEAKLPDVFLNWFQNRQNKERQLLLFVPTIHLAATLSKQLKSVMPQETILSVHADDAERTEKVLSFRNKQSTILITTTILERGVTFPAIDVVVIDAGHVVFDEAALIQIAGRAGRSAEDPTGEVVFYHDGKTNAMVEAIYNIKLMNKRGGF